MSTVEVADVRRLLDSDQKDPVMVLQQGRPLVIAADEQDSDEYRGALFLTARDTLLGQGNASEDVERLAATLSAMADQLGA